MANTKSKSESPRSDVREKPITSLVVVVLGFVVIAALGVATVLWPELTDDGPEADEPAASGAASDETNDETNEGATEAPAPPPS